MSAEGKFNTISVVAGADLSGMQYKLIQVGGTMAATPAGAAGVLQNKPQSGEHATLAYQGHMKAFAGGTITAGAKLSCTASGTLSAVNSGETVIGKALTAASSGGMCEFIGDFSNAQ